MDQREPAFLKVWLPSPPGPKALARGLVLFAWSQTALWIPLPIVLLRDGLAPFALVLGLGEGLVVLVAALSVGSARLGAPALVVYGGAAALVVAGVTAGAFGGWA
jgi:hypothetical protein